MKNRDFIEQRKLGYENLNVFSINPVYDEPDQKLDGLLSSG